MRFGSPARTTIASCNARIKNGVPLWFKRLPATSVLPRAPLLVQQCHELHNEFYDSVKCGIFWRFRHFLRDVGQEPSMRDSPASHGKCGHPTVKWSLIVGHNPLGHGFPKWVPVLGSPQYIHSWIHQALKFSRLSLSLSKRFLFSFKHYFTRPKPRIHARTMRKKHSLECVLLFTRPRGFCTSLMHEYLDQEGILGYPSRQG